MIKKIIFAFFLLGLIIFLSSSLRVRAADCDDKSGQEKVDCLQNKVNNLHGQSKTLSSQISIMDSQINLTEARIEANKRDILDLTLDIDTATKKIETLQDSLNKITEVLLNRIVATYEAGSVQPLEMLLSSTDASNLLVRLNYLRIAQAHDKRLIYDVQQAKNDYTNQKDIYEAKKKKVESLKLQLEAYTNQLSQEKAGKRQLLDITQNDENKYQQLLNEAIVQSAISKGLGEETYLRDVSEGENIGSIINSSSGCSSGRHLHFQVESGNSLQDPSGYLKNISFVYSYDSGYYNYYGTINPRGSWNWPMSEPITINQGFGSTGYARNFGYENYIHPGIDLESSNSEVKSVKAGKLYRGSIQCGGKYPGVLPYAKIDHGDGVVVYYEHMYAQ